MREYWRSPPEVAGGSGGGIVRRLVVDRLAHADAEAAAGRPNAEGRVEDRQPQRHRALDRIGIRNRDCRRQAVADHLEIRDAEVALEQRHGDRRQPDRVVEAIVNAAGDRVERDAERRPTTDRLGPERPRMRAAQRPAGPGCVASCCGRRAVEHAVAKRRPPSRGDRGSRVGHQRRQCGEVMVGQQTAGPRVPPIGRDAQDTRA